MGGIRRRVAALRRMRVTGRLVSTGRRAAVLWRSRLSDQVVPFCRRGAAFWRERLRDWLEAVGRWAAAVWRVRVRGQLVPFCRRAASVWRVRVRGWLVAIQRRAAPLLRRLRVRDQNVPLSVRAATSLGVTVSAYLGMLTLGLAAPEAAVPAVLLGAALLLAPLVDRDAPLAAPTANGSAPTADGGDGRRICVCVPTYEEAGNLRPFVTTLLDVFDRTDLDGTVLVIDDASPDGTGALADQLAAEDARVHVLQPVCVAEVVYRYYRL